MHLVVFIIKKFVTMHGHMNVEKYCDFFTRFISARLDSNTRLSRTRYGNFGFMKKEIADK